MRFSNKFFIAILFLLSYSLFAQDSGAESGGDDLENLDDLFSEPESDIIIEEPETDHREQFEIADKVKFSGTFSATGVVAAGWSNWNFINDISDGFDASAGLKSSLKLSFDARPTSEFRVFGSVSTAFNPYESLQDAGTSLDDLVAAWTSPTVNTIYCDYTLRDVLFSRLGKFSFKWGQGRFYTPGNLMSGSEDSSFNFRFSLPSLAGLSFVLLTNNSTHYKDFTYACKIDFVFGETLISPGISYNDTDAFKTVLSFKQVILKTDLLIDFVTAFTYQGLESLHVVTGFYHEWDKVKFYGEYHYSAQISSFTTNSYTHNHESSLALGWSKPFGTPFNLGLQWVQYYNDGSGKVTLGLNQKIFPYMDMEIGLPIIYGKDGSKAVASNNDPSGRRIALGLALKLKGSF